VGFDKRIWVGFRLQFRRRFWLKLRSCWRLSLWFSEWRYGDGRWHRCGGWRGSWRGGCGLPRLDFAGW
jgi:hypothetical protein